MIPSSFIIAGTDSGSGKTTVTLVVLAALAKRGLKVQAFKAGPDYIDPTYHNGVAPHQRSRNLDTWLCTPEQVKHFYARAMKDAEVGVVEGVMGLFDGKVEKNLDTSTAALAKLLNLPVILVIDASRMAQSVGAIVHGFLEFDKKVKLAGVILNRVGGECHYQFLKELIESKFPVKCFGYLPAEKELNIPERHLGLVPAQENQFSVEALSLAGKHLDLDAMLTHPPASQCAPLSRGRGTRGAGRTKSTECVRLGIARDAAFHFYYDDALEEFSQAGFKIVPFSPLNAAQIPVDLDALYFGGGFPEMFDKQLMANTLMIQSLRRWMQDKKPVLAECGGLMYLVNLGIIPGKIRMTGRLQNFGYKEMQPLENNFLFTSEEKIRVHEFHYSVWDRESDTHFAFSVDGVKQGFWNGHILASYYHCHLGACPNAIRRFYEISAHQNLHENRR
ncbi:MAG: cobyrinate a,c-diamide synthase [Candidatus Omnitrophica bacterium]|nr:cobyrinate a,c-diamide synthase [Candidatus Omnitrophota bacterium]